MIPVERPIGDDARRVGAELMRRIADMVRALMHPHGWQHGPGGADPVRIPVEFLANMQITARPAAGNTLVYTRMADEGDDYWTNGAGGGGSAHQSYLIVSLPDSIVPKPGPKNLSASARTITALNVMSDGAVIGTATGGTFEIGAGGGEVALTGLATSWAVGERLAYTIDWQGTDATYLAIDWLVS